MMDTTKVLHKIPPINRYLVSVRVCVCVWQMQSPRLIAIELCA